MPAAALRALLCQELGNETLGVEEAVERCARRTTALLCAAPGAANASVCAQLVTASAGGNLVPSSRGAELPLAYFVHVWWTMPLMLQITMIAIVAVYVIVGIVGCIRLVRDGGVEPREGDAAFTASSYMHPSATGSGIPVGDESASDEEESGGDSSSAVDSGDAGEDDDE